MSIQAVWHIENNELPKSHYLDGRQGFICQYDFAES